MENNEKVKCACCGYLTIEADSNFEICPVCFWEDDPLQNDNKDYAGGANNVSLNQAKENFLQFGAAEKTLIKFVRKAFVDEID